MLPEGVARALCTRYNLGALTALPVSVTGGLIHRLYRLDATTGIFAVKALNPEIMRYENIYDNLRRSEAVAAEFAAAGIPAVLALDTPGGVVQDFDAVTVIVYPWCDGTVLPKSAASPEEAYQIGAILGRMHALNLPGKAPPEPQSVRKPMAKDPWMSLVRRGQEQQIEWASVVEAALPNLFSWDKDRIAADSTLPQALVLSHCDLDQKNVIWQNNTPFLIDWESAGLTYPCGEILGAALDWSGQNAGLPSRAAFAAVLAGYRQHGKLDPDLALPLVRSRLGGWIEWLGASMNRSLDSKATSSERAVGVREALDTLATMYALAAGMETWAGWCA